MSGNGNQSRLDYSFHRVPCPEKVVADKAEAERITRRSKHNVVVGDKLIRHGALSRVHMKSISDTEGTEYLKKSTQESVETTLLPARWLEKLFGRDSTGLQQWPMQKTS
jgi:hypothetical protein